MTSSLQSVSYLNLVFFVFLHGSHSFPLKFDLFLILYFFFNLVYTTFFLLKRVKCMLTQVGLKYFFCKSSD